MTNIKMTDKLAAMFEPAIKAEGCTLFDLDYREGTGSSLLRVYIDKDGGVGVEDCARISRQLEFLLDSEECISGPYLLEVSSPGLTRALKKPSDYTKSIGKLAAISAKKTIDGGKGGKFIGVIEAVDQEKASIRLKSGDLAEFNITDITKANLEIEF